MKFNLSTSTFLLGVLATAALSSCDNDSETTPDVAATEQEHRYVRVLVSDEQATKLTQITPFDASVASFDTKFPLANLYTTASGRFAAVLYQSQNLVEMFDTGLESHVDHVDVKGTPKWAAITATGPKPTHFKSKNTESLIFNDGDGTLSAGNDADFHTPGAKFKTINAGLLPHHGAMAQFDNGNYAVTAAATSGASPTSVRVVSSTGSLVHASTLTTGSIHGNATDGQNAVFGCFTTSANTSGSVLVVKQSGEQRLIANPADFGAFRLGSIYYAEAANKFIGYVATKGAYLIDLSSDKITPIYTGTDAIQCKVDQAGSNLLILTLDGKLRVYDLATGTLKKEGQAIAATPAADTYKPVLEATERFAYIAVPSLGEVHQVKLTDFGSVTKHKVSARPVRLTVAGFESSASH
ncbi:hypothetical protein MUN82_11755 [Hymenobacter aerilatus]|uniref:Lipoprotein n=1 Tax=Hymenobacter aerilatus TaxID=2932251 RepID=A0A8T9SS98_9BACT|nr:hypothetical protein [Hymenobacter aerilatus]UOR03623.1 hypothetical protein MUN82_11755 [Hymenobacter aerilatus]